MLQKIYNSNKACYFKFSIHQTTILTTESQKYIDHNRSCDTEHWSNGCWNFAITGIHFYILNAWKHKKPLVIFFVIIFLNINFLTVFWSNKCSLGVGLVRIPFFELRSFGSNQHRMFEASEGGGWNIFFSLIKAGISVCLFAFYYVENRSSIRLHVWWVCCCGPKGVQCCILVAIWTRNIQN